MVVVFDGIGTGIQLTGRGSGLHAYRVRACNGALCSEWSGVASVSVLLPPGPAPVLSAPSVAYGGAYTVTWSHVAGATRYELDEFAADVWTSVYVGGSDSFGVVGKAAGSYGYRVRACNDAGCGAVSPMGTVQVVLAPGASPVLALPSSSANGSFIVSWTGVASAETYELHEQSEAGPWSAIHVGPATSVARGGRSTGQWHYRVRACNGAGCGGFSPVGTVSVVLPPTGVPAVSAPGFSSTGQFAVTWTGVAAATHYGLEQHHDSTGWVPVYAGAEGVWHASGLGAGVYGYRVQACNSGGCGPYSSGVSTQVIPPPTSVPTLTSSVPDSSGHFVLAWGGVGDATYYAIEELAASGAWAGIMTGPAGEMLVLRPPGTYLYRALACNAAGCGAPSGNLLVSVVAACPECQPDALPPGDTSRSGVSRQGGR